VIQFYDLSRDPRRVEVNGDEGIANKESACLWPRVSMSSSKKRLPREQVHSPRVFLSANCLTEPLVSSNQAPATKISLL